jgi:hypothetical protein
VGRECQWEDSACVAGRAGRHGAGCRLLASPSTRDAQCAVPRVTTEAPGVGSGLSLGRLRDGLSLGRLRDRIFQKRVFIPGLVHLLLRNACYRRAIFTSFVGRPDVARSELRLCHQPHKPHLRFMGCPKFACVIFGIERHRRSCSRQNVV